jgi:predicted nucleic acid-binding protein
VIVVSDSSPLIGLASVGQLDLLQRLYDRLVIPEAVFREVTGRGRSRPGAEAVAKADWIDVSGVTDQTAVAALRGELGPGEAEAIVLAQELRADALLCDDHKARSWARARGLTVVGIAGVLMTAKEEGIIPVVRPLLDSLMAEKGFRLSRALYRQVLELVDEDVIES